MINLKNALVLAGTKLKTKKIRLIITIVISSLMFGVVSFVVFVVGGINISINNFADQGFNNRYLVQALDLKKMEESNKIYELIQSKSAEFENAKAKIAKEELIRQEKRAKELGIEFDKVGAKDRINLDIEQSTSPRLQQELVEELKLVSDETSLERLTALAKPYKPINIIESRDYYLPASPIARNKDGKFETTESNQTGQKDIYQPFPGDFGYGGDYQYINVLPKNILKSFLFENQTWNKESGTIPILLSGDKLTKILKLDKLDSNNNPEKAAARQKEIREKARGLKIEACYINPVAQAKIQAIKDHYENKSKPDYIKPAVIYAEPDMSKCEMPNIISDTRTKTEKDYEEKLNIFNYEFYGVEYLPIVKPITYEVVGVLPSQDQDWDMITSILNLVVGTIPTTFAGASEDFELIKDTNPYLVFGNNQYSQQNVFNQDKNILVEFADKQTAIRFVKEIDFWSNINFSNQNVGPINYDTGSGFSITPYGSNFLQIDEMNSMFNKALKISLLVTGVIAMIILSGTIGRMISDSRRETAVFRAIGFKRTDISLVYGLYTLIVSLLIGLAALAIGSISSLLVAQRFDQSLTARAITILSSNNFTKRVTLFGVNYSHIGLIIIAIISVGLISITIPLMRNVRRNPIKDMRDE